LVPEHCRKKHTAVNADGYVGSTEESKTEISVSVAKVSIS